MLKIKSLKLSELPFKLNKQGDIYYYNGPILSHFKTENEDNYFMFWVDNDKKHNRWLLFKVTHEILIQYFSKQITLFNIVSLVEVSYIIDIDNNVDYKRIYTIQTNQIHDDYLPGGKSHFNEIIATDYARNLESIYKNEHIKNKIMENLEKNIELIKDAFIVYCVKRYENDDVIQNFVENIKYFESKRQLVMKTPNKKNLFEDKLDELRADKEQIYATMKEQASDSETIAYYEQQAKEFGDIDIEILEDRDPIGFLKILMEVHQLKNKDLVDILDIKIGEINQILSYKKKLSKDVVRKLSEHFKLSQEAFK